MAGERQWKIWCSQNATDILFFRSENRPTEICRAVFAHVWRFRSAKRYVIFQWKDFYCSNSHCIYSEFSLYVATGTDDEAFDIATRQMISLLKFSDMFIPGENTSCSMMLGGTHTLSAVYTYMKHILPTLFQDWKRARFLKFIIFV